MTRVFTEQMTTKRYATISSFVDFPQSQIDQWIEVIRSKAESDVWNVISRLFRPQTYDAEVLFLHGPSLFHSRKRLLPNNRSL